MAAGSAGATETAAGGGRVGDAIGAVDFSHLIGSA